MILFEFTRYGLIWWDVLLIILANWQSWNVRRGFQFSSKIIHETLSYTFQNSLPKQHLWAYVLGSGCLKLSSLCLTSFDQVFFVHGKPLWLGYKMNYLWKTNKTSLDSGSSCSSLGLYLFTTYLSFLTVPCAFFSWSVSWWFLKWHVGRFFWAQHLLGMNVMSQISNKHHQRKAWCTPWFFNTSLKETFREGTLHTATSNKKYAPED